MKAIHPPYRACIVSLGCPKNLVDSEVIAGHLARGAFEIVRDPEEADFTIVNTCGFVESAQRESLETIHEVLRLKTEGRLAGVLVVGCLVQRFRQALREELDGVDAFLPITDYSGIPGILHALAERRDEGLLRGPGGLARTAETDLGRALLTRPHVSYLRIAEGCNHRCAFCAIPAIRGRLRSRPLRVLAREAADLASAGVREINLVAEDTTDYGRDLAGSSLLPELLRRLGRIAPVRWIRLLYAYPSRVTDALLEEMAGNPRVLKYIDMPIQHMSRAILKSMRRGTGPGGIRSLVARLRNRIPGIVIRTSVIVGYPGETEEDFNELYAFLESARFERLGAFLFSAEEGTSAARLEGRVPLEKARERLDRVMKLQERIIRDRNKSLVGTEEEVIVDAVLQDGRAFGRTRADAPDIDCAVLLRPARRLKPGMLIQARVTGHQGYDLLATPVSESPDPRN